MSCLLNHNQSNAISFVMINASGVEVPGLGSSPVVRLSKAGGGFAVGTGTLTEIGSGWYRYVASPADCDTVGSLDVAVTAAGCQQQNLDYAVESIIPGAVAFVYTLTNSVDSSPIAGANIWITTDPAGNAVVAAGLTDAAGQVAPYLAPGTYYIWRSKPGFSFVNPDVETI